MFNYIIITRIKPNSSIKDCSVIISSFNPFRSLSAGVRGHPTINREEEEGRKHGGMWKEGKDDRKKGKSVDTSLKCLNAW